MSIPGNFGHPDVWRELTRVLQMEDVDGASFDNGDVPQWDAVQGKFLGVPFQSVYWSRDALTPGLEFLYPTTGTDSVLLGGAPGDLPGGRLEVHPNSINQVGILVRGLANQSAFLQRWQSATGSTFVHITALGGYRATTGSSVFDVALLPTASAGRFVLLDGTVTTTGLTGSAAWSGLEIDRTGTNAPGPNYFLNFTDTGTLLARIDDAGHMSLRGSMRWLEASGANYIGFQAPASLSGDTLWTLPSADGTAGQVLTTSGTIGSSVLSWTTITGGGDSFWTRNTTTVGEEFLYPTTSPDKVTIGAATSPAASAQLFLIPTVATRIGQQIEGAIGQSADYQQWLNSAGQIEARMLPGGHFWLAGPAQFQELLGNGPNYVGFQAPDDLTASTLWTLPLTDGDDGQVLVTDGAGQLSWGDALAADGPFVFLTPATSARNVVTPTVDNVCALTLDHTSSNDTPGDALRLQIDGITRARFTENNANDNTSGYQLYFDGGVEGYTFLRNPIPGDSNSSAILDSYFLDGVARHGVRISKAGWFYGSGGLGGINTSTDTLYQHIAVIAGSRQNFDYESWLIDGVGFRFFSPGNVFATNMAADVNGAIIITAPASNAAGLGVRPNNWLTNTRIFETRTPGDGLRSYFGAFGNLVIAPTENNGGSNWDATVPLLINFEPAIALTANAIAFQINGQTLWNVLPDGGQEMRGELRFQEAVANGNNYLGFKAPANLAANTVWTLPDSDGLPGQVLTTQGTAGGHALVWGSGSGGGDLSGAVILAPTTSARNVVTPTTAAVVALTLRGAVSQSADLLLIQDSTPTTLAHWDSTGKIFVPAARISNFTGMLKGVGGDVALAIPQVDYEPSLGQPATDGYILSSTTTGTRSWIQVSSLTDLSGAVILAPATSARNVIAGADATVTPLTLKGATSQTAVLLALLENTTNVAQFQAGGHLWLQRELRLGTTSGPATNYVGFKAPASLAGTTIWTLPATDGTPGQVLTTSGTAGGSLLSWSTTAGATDLAGAVILAPGSSVRNLVVPTGDFVPFLLRGSASQTLDLQQWQETGGTVLGSVSATGATLHRVRDSATNSATVALTLAHKTTAALSSIAAGFGGEVRLNADANGTADRPVGRFLWEWVVAADATRTGRLSLSAYDWLAPREGLRLESDGANALMAIGGTVVAGVRTILYSGAAANIGLIIRQAASPLSTANPLQIDNNSGTALAWFDPTGKIFVPNARINTFSGLLKGVAGDVALATPSTDYTIPADLAGYVLLAPTSSARNVIQPTGAGFLALSLKGFAAQSANLLEIRDSADAAWLNTPVGGHLWILREMRWGELAANGSNYVGFKAPDTLGANTIWTLPSADGTSNQVLTTNGTGGLSWTTVATGSTNLTGAVILAPNSSTRNLIQPTGAAFVPLLVRGAASQSADLFQLQDSAAATLTRFDPTGKIFVPNARINTFTGLLKASSGDVAVATASTDYVIPADLAGYVLLAPTTSVRNVITPTGAAVIPFVLKGFAAQSANLLEIRDSANTMWLNTPVGGHLWVAREMRWGELAANGANYVGFKAADTLGANTIWTLPSADGTNNQVLTTNGTGGLSWTTLAPGVTDLSGAVILAPNSATRNLVVPTAANFPALLLRGAASQSADLLIFQNSTPTVLGVVNALGQHAIGASTTSGHMLRVFQTGSTGSGTDETQPSFLPFTPLWVDQNVTTIDAGGGPDVGGINLRTNYTATNPTASDLTHTGVDSRIRYGTRASWVDATGTLARGTVHSFTSVVDILNSADNSANEFANFMGYARFRGNPGTSGSLWFMDLSAHGPINTQPGLLNGITMFINNYYNGLPIRGPSAAMWLVTQPGQGAGAELGHNVATTYPVEYGLAIIGSSTGGVGFRDAIHIGSGVHPWKPSGTSSLERGIHIEGVTSEAIRLVGNNIGIVWGNEGANGGKMRLDRPNLFELQLGNITDGGLFRVWGREGAVNDPVIEGKTTAVQALAMRLQHGAGGTLNSFSMALVAATNQFGTGTATGDSVLRFTNGRLLGGNGTLIHFLFSGGTLQLGNGGTDPSPRAILDLSSTTKGVLIPRMTTGQRTTMAGTLLSSEFGVLVYDLTLNQFYFWNGTAWVPIQSGTGGSQNWTSSAGTLFPTSNADRVLIRTNVDQGAGISLAVNGVNTTTNDPLALFYSAGAGDSNSIILKNGTGNLKLFVSGALNTFMTGTVAGDVGIIPSLGRFHIGSATASWLKVSSGFVGISLAAGVDPTTNLDVRGRLAVTTTGTTPDLTYPSPVVVTRPASNTAQYLSFVRAATAVWSMGMLPSSSIFSIGGGNATDTSFAGLFNLDLQGRILVGRSAAPSSGLVAEFYSDPAVPKALGLPIWNNQSEQDGIFGAVGGMFGYQGADGTLRYHNATVWKILATADQLITAHGGLTGLDADDHANYFWMSGRNFVQLCRGGTLAGADFVIQSTSHAIKGLIQFGSSVYDEFNQRLGIRLTNPQYALDVNGDVRLTQNLTGVLRADNGVVSVDSSIGQVVQYWSRNSASNYLFTTTAGDRVLVGSPAGTEATTTFSVFTPSASNDEICRMGKGTQRYVIVGNNGGVVMGTSGSPVANVVQVNNATLTLTPVANGAHITTSAIGPANQVGALAGYLTVSSGGINYASPIYNIINASPPAAPTGLTLNVISTSQINLAWTDQSSDETSFGVERSLDGVSYGQIATTAANTPSYANTGLTASTNYWYRVRASNAAGNSAYSTAGPAQTLAPAATGAKDDFNRPNQTPLGTPTGGQTSPPLGWTYWSNGGADALQFTILDATPGQAATGQAANLSGGPQNAQFLACTLSNQTADGTVKATMATLGGSTGGLLFRFDSSSKTGYVVVNQSSQWKVIGINLNQSSSAVYGTPTDQRGASLGTPADNDIIEIIMTAGSPTVGFRINGGGITQRDCPNNTTATAHGLFSDRISTPGGNFRWDNYEFTPAGGVGSSLTDDFSGTWPNASGGQTWTFSGSWQNNAGRASCIQGTALFCTAALTGQGTNGTLQCAMPVVPSFASGGISGFLFRASLGAHTGYVLTNGFGGDSTNGHIWRVYYVTGLDQTTYSWNTADFRGNVTDGNTPGAGNPIFAANGDILKIVLIDSTSAAIYVNKGSGFTQGCVFSNLTNNTGSASHGLFLDRINTLDESSRWDNYSFT